MAKIKLNDFKKFLASLSEEEVRAEMLKLIKLEQVQAFYAQDLMSDEARDNMLAEYKTKITRQLITPTGKPKSNISNVNIRKLISNFEKVASFEYDVIDLILHRVEVTMEADFITEHWGLKSGDYNAALNAFERMIKMIESNNMLSHFEARCDALMKRKGVNAHFQMELYQIYYKIKDIPELTAFYKKHYQYYFD
jgi:Family of unknown function (DUF6155)